MKRLLVVRRRPAPPVGRRRHLAPRIAAVLAALALSGLLPASTFAHHLDSGMSMSITGDIHLVSGVYLAVPVSVTCPALTDPLSAIASDVFGVNVTENVGKQFAYGTGTQGYTSPDYGYGTAGSPVTCDGSPHAYVLNVYPAQGAEGAPNSPPFKKGNKAVLSGFFNLYPYDPGCGIYCGADENVYSFGPQSIQIK